MDPLIFLPLGVAAALFGLVEYRLRVFRSEIRLKRLSAIACAHADQMGRTGHEKMKMATAALCTLADISEAKARIYVEAHLASR